MVQVDIKNIHKTLKGTHHPSLCFSDNVTFVLEGKMTKAQQTHIKQAALVSRSKLIAALEWLIANNPLYAASCKNYDVNSIPTPVVVDHSFTDNIESLNTNIELQQEVCVVFPDSTLNEVTGGYQSINDFKQRISELNNGSTAITITSKSAEYVYSNTNNNFIKAFPKQFPYGVSGPNDFCSKKRVKSVGLTLMFICIMLIFFLMETFILQISV